MTPPPFIEPPLSMDGHEHAAGEFIGRRGRHPAYRQIQRDHPELAGLDRGPQLASVGFAKPAEAVHLFD